MRLTVLFALAFLALAGALWAEETAGVRAADGFQCPVGPDGTGEGYYVARGYRPNGHLGEDWNGVKGGDTDLGDPIYSVAHGIVMFAKNYHVGWGNVVIIRHAYYEGLSLKYVDSLYGHLLNFKVEVGEQVKRGQLIGHLGSNNGMYDAHLHFEMRKNLQIGMYRSSFARDLSNYYSPSHFIAGHRVCDRGNRLVDVPINTFPANAPPSYAAGPKVYTPMYSPGTAPANPAISSEVVLPPPRRMELRTTVKPTSTPEPSPEPRVTAKVTPSPSPTPTPKPSVAAQTPTPAPKTVGVSKTSETSEPTPRKVAVEKSTPAPKSVAKTTPLPKPAPKTTPASKASVKATPAPKSVAYTTLAPVRKPSKDGKPARTAPEPVAAKPASTSSSAPGPKEQSLAASATPSPATTKPSALDAESYDPSPILTPGSPIRRGSGTFKVDRYEDMRGGGY